MGINCYKSIHLIKTNGRDIKSLVTEIVSKLVDTFLYLWFRIRKTHNKKIVFIIMYIK